MVLDKCFENCFVFIKIKYIYYYGKKKNKRIGRLFGGYSNLVCVLKKVSKRRKRWKNVFVYKKKCFFVFVDNILVGFFQGSGGEDEDDLDEGDDDFLSEGSIFEQQDELQEELEMLEKKLCFFLFI